jgi:hypothetical protein
VLNFIFNLIFFVHASSTTSNQLFKPLDNLLFKYWRFAPQQSNPKLRHPLSSVATLKSNNREETIWVWAKEKSLSHALLEIVVSGLKGDAARLTHGSGKES